MSTVLVCVLAVILDTWLGEPRRAHPLAAFSRLAAWVENRLGRDGTRLEGAVAAVLLLGVPMFAVALLASFGSIGLLVQTLVLYLALGASSLIQQAQAVAAALRADDVVLARQQVQWMIRRDSSRLDRDEVARAAVGSVLEHGNNAVFGALFWYLLLGAPGAVLYRLAYILDTTWGMHRGQGGPFGWVAGRLNRLLNWIPARLTAVTYLVLGESGPAWWLWRELRADLSGAGVAVAAGAGALGVQVTGAAGVATGLVPSSTDILRAVRLMRNGLLLWLGVIATEGFFLG